MNTDVKRQTTLRITYSKLPEWRHRVQKMEECTTLDALVTLCGPPHNKVQEEDLEVWRYPLGVESGLKYSIHVWVRPDQSKQVILYFEPVSGGNAVWRRRWWQFWKRKHEAKQRART